MDRGAASFLGGLLAPVGEAFLAKADQEHQEKLDAKKQRMNVVLAALNSGDLENPETALDMLLNDGVFGSKGKSKKGNDGVIESIRSIFRGHGDATKREAIVPPATVPGPGGDELGQEGVTPEIAPVSARTAVPTALADLPGRLRFTTPEQKAQRAIDLKKAEAAIDVDKAKALAEFQQAPGVTYITGDLIPPDVAADADDQAIERRANARYRVRQYKNGTKVYERVESRQAPAVEQKILQAAQNMKAVDQQNGVPLKTDEEYERLARVEDRLNTINVRNERKARFDQFMKLSANQIQRGTQLYQQAAQLFPLTLAVRELAPDLAQARLNALQSKDATKTLATATSMARSLMVSPLAGEYFGKPLTEVRDKLLSEWGESIDDLTADIAAANEPDRKTGTTPKPPKVASKPPKAPASTDPTQDPDLRALAKAALVAAGRESDEAHVTTLLKDPANVKVLRGGR